MPKVHGTHPRLGSRPRVTPELTELLRREREAGARIKDLARKHGLCPQTVTRALQREDAGVSLAGFATREDRHGA